VNTDIVRIDTSMVIIHVRRGIQLHSYLGINDRKDPADKNVLSADEILIRSYLSNLKISVPRTTQIVILRASSTAPFAR
jgi:hypothetical protein